MDIETQTELPIQDTSAKKGEKNKLSTPMAIVFIGVIIAGAILLSGRKNTTNIVPNNDNNINSTTLAPINKNDRTLGDTNAPVTLIVYEDFQCPYCGAISGFMKTNNPVMQSLRRIDPTWTPFIPEIINNYVKNGKVLFAYRDYAFLGPESIRAAEAGRCAGDQNKFWEYHDYLYSHQNGENQGAFSDSNLKSFALNLGLDVTTFNKCLDNGKYTQAVIDSKNEGNIAGVKGTPKGFILRNGKLITTIDGAESLSTVKSKINAALK